MLLYNHGPITAKYIVGYNRRKIMGDKSPKNKEKRKKKQANKADKAKVTSTVSTPK
jgi:hypothetical protein